MTLPSHPIYLLSHYHRSIISCLMAVALPLYFSPTSSAQEIPYDSLFKAYQLVDIQEVNRTIMVDLMYASEANFMKSNVYGSLTRAYMLKGIANKLHAAQEILTQERGQRYSIIIYDAARPHSIQAKMWATVRGTKGERYVASPGRKNGRHTYGAAVDLSIYDHEAGKALDMGSPVDHFGERAHTGNESQLLRDGLISKEAYQNRLYLIQLMKRVGLRPIPNEWWHFQEYEGISEVKKKYKHLDF